MAAALGPEDGQCGADAVQDALDVDVDHVVPLRGAQIVQGRDGAHPGIADEHVEPAEPLAREPDQGAYVVEAGHIRTDLHGLAAGLLDACDQFLQPLRAARSEDEARSALGEQQCGRLADAAARPRDGHDLARDA